MFENEVMQSEVGEEVMPKVVTEVVVNGKTYTEVMGIPVEDFHKAYLKVKEYAIENWRKVMYVSEKDLQMCGFKPYFVRMYIDSSDGVCSKYDLPYVNSFYSDLYNNFSVSLLDYEPHVVTTDDWEYEVDWDDEESVAEYEEYLDYYANEFPLCFKSFEEVMEEFIGTPN